MSDLVVISLEPWDEVWRRNQWLVTGLLRRDPALRVLFVEPGPDPLHALRRRTRPHRGRGLRPGPQLPGVGAGRLWLHEPTKVLPRRLDPGQDRRWAARVVAVAARLGLTRPTLWVNDTRGVEVLRRTGWPTLYDVTDDWLAADRPAAEHDRLVEQERVLLDSAAEVVVCSPALVRTKGRDRAVTLVPNGVDTAAYADPGPRPADLPAGPVAVYLGTVHTDRMDLDLCVRTAEAVAADGTLVLVGPDLLAPADRARLTAAGVALLGRRDHAAVPAYLTWADVLVVPHLVTGFTDSLDPIKRYEYAAAGRPVVSTPVAGFTDDPDVTVVAAHDFPDAVRATLAAAAGAPRPARPHASAVGPSVDWQARAEQIAAVLARL